MGANGISQTADFQNALPQADTSWFGQDQVTDGDTTFTSGIYSFDNSYDANWGSFTGWSFSNTTDVTTAGPSNQFSNITGSGESSDQFGICYASPYGSSKIYTSSGTAFTPSGAYFTNTTYAFQSMTNGDGAAKTFGDTLDANGDNDGTNGEDWFLLTIYGLNADSTATGDSINFYLADYRFANDVDDYIINTWTWIDLSSFTNVYGLDFKMTSSDVGNWGMNTPSYFAMDNLSGFIAGTDAEEGFSTATFPNPTTGNLTISAPINSNISLYDLSGKLIQSSISVSNQTNWDISYIESGIYFVSIENNGIISTRKIIKK